MSKRAAQPRSPNGLPGESQRVRFFAGVPGPRPAVAGPRTPLKSHMRLAAPPPESLARLRKIAVAVAAVAVVAYFRTVGL